MREPPFPIDAFIRRHALQIPSVLLWREAWQSCNAGSLPALAADPAALAAAGFAQSEDGRWHHALLEQLWQEHSAQRQTRSAIARQGGLASAKRHHLPQLSTEVAPIGQPIPHDTGRAGQPGSKGGQTFAAPPPEPHALSALPARCQSTDSALPEPGTKQLVPNGWYLKDQTKAGTSGSKGPVPIGAIAITAAAAAPYIDDWDCLVFVLKRWGWSDQEAQDLRNHGLRGRWTDLGIERSLAKCAYITREASKGSNRRDQRNKPLAAITNKVGYFVRSGGMANERDIADAKDQLNFARETLADEKARQALQRDEVPK